MSHPPIRLDMADVIAKWDRAQEHLKTLNNAVRSFFDDDPYTIATEPDHEQRCHVVRLVNPGSVPMRAWSVLIGDCVHNLRCTLDYIAWQLAGSDLNDRATQFPVCDTPHRFNSFAGRRLTRLSSSAMTFLECLQPYQGRNENRPIWAIDTIEKLDIAR